MPPDRDIARGVRHMIERYGERAALVAELRARQLRSAGDIGAAEVWDEIAAALRDEERKPGAPPTKGR